MYLWLLVIVNPLSFYITGGIGCKCSLLQKMIMYLWLLVIVNPLACYFTCGIGCKCRLLQKDDFASMVVILQVVLDVNAVYYKKMIMHLWLLSYRWYWM